MKVVALISGGKDSCFNMMHCVANGHTISALANLHPAPKMSDEIDSWMYQTVGHDIIPLYAEAMDLPLYREVISGTNVQTSLHYSTANGDETEDLYRLLDRIKREHPDIEGVSVGAIASNYQRLRVENVAFRLQLTVLAYLWERDQSDLLTEMIDTGVIAILIKVACIGLNRQHLGMTLSEIQGRMMSLHEKYQVHPCGEGGEYETIVLDCPLFIKALTIVEQEVVDLEGDTAYLRLKANVLGKKREEDTSWTRKVLEAAALDRIYCDLAENLQQDDTIMSEFTNTACSIAYLPDEQQTASSLITHRFTFSTQDCLSRILPFIEPNKVLHSTLILQDMADFGVINAEYARLWTPAQHPPSRICFSTALPTNTRCVLYLFSTSLTTACRTDSDSDDRRLWVQSRSYWAPSNIGPYSQLVTSYLESETLPADAEGEEARKYLTFVSGQIGLVPNTMKLASSIGLEIGWALQSLNRILSSHKLSLSTGVLIFYFTSTRAFSAIKGAMKWSSHQLGVGVVGIQLLHGSALPRNANIELQYISQASLSDRPRAADRLTTFSTISNTGIMTIPVLRIVLENGVQIDEIGICIEPL